MYSLVLANAPGYMFAVNGVGSEHAAKEQHFGDEERPHAEHGRIHLLLRRRKVMAKVSILRRELHRDLRAQLCQPTISSSSP